MTVKAVKETVGGGAATAWPLYAGNSCLNQIRNIFLRYCSEVLMLYRRRVIFLLRKRIRIRLAIKVVKFKIISRGVFDNSNKQLIIAH